MSNETIEEATPVVTVDTEAREAIAEVRRELASVVHVAEPVHPLEQYRSFSDYRLAVWNGKEEQRALLDQVTDSAGRIRPDEASLARSVALTAEFSGSPLVWRVCAHLHLLADRRDDQRFNLGARQLLGHVTLQQNNFRLFLGGEVGATAGLELRDGFAPLFDHFFDDGEDLCVVEHDALVDFALFDRRLQHADVPEAIFIACAHGILHVLRDALLERHRRFRLSARARCAANCA